MDDVMQEFMSENRAREVLSSPLKFGDDAQTKALRFLRDKALAKELIGRCEHMACVSCNGTGYCPLDEDLCDCCGGNGTMLPCRCFAGLNRYAVVAARKELKGK